MGQVGELRLQAFQDQYQRASDYLVCPLFFCNNKPWPLIACLLNYQWKSVMGDTPHLPICFALTCQCNEVHIFKEPSQTEVECTCSAMQCTLQVHCSLCSVPAVQAAHGLLWRHFLHCTYTASKWQCTCSVRAAYTAATLPVHSTLVWASTYLHSAG